MTELKPCPFCGGEAQLLKQTTSTYVPENKKYGQSLEFYRARCIFCGAALPGDSWLLSEKTAVDEWNNRTEAKEVVRCKDCTYLHVLNLEGNYAVCTFHNLMFTASDWEERIAKKFCSWGRESE